MEQKFEYQSMGTTWKITIWDTLPEEKLEKVKERIIKESNEFDETYSRFKKNSLVWKIADQGAGAYEVTEDFLNMLRLYMDLYLLSDKKLNPLLGFTISDLGYDENYSLKPKENIRSAPDLLETIKIIREKIEVKEAVLFDFGALGKGYFVDKIKSILEESGIKKFLVDGSGDIYYSGLEPIKAGLEDPEDSKKVIGVVDMAAEAMCASGINRRKWSNQKNTLNHVIDPTTSTSQEEIIATWVVAKNCALADALATCLFFTPPENFLAPRSFSEVGSNYDFKYLIMNKYRQVKYSDNLKVDLY